MVSTSFSLKDLVPMIFCCSKDLADELGICIVDMGLVGARDLGGLVRLRRSPISKETPKASATSPAIVRSVKCLRQDYYCLKTGSSFALGGLRYFYFLLDDHFSYSSPFVLFYQKWGENQSDNALDLLFSWQEIFCSCQNVENLL